MSESSPPSGSTSKLAFPGAVLVGKYRLEEVVGYGGMGSVWAATHLGLNQQIALKLVSSTFARSKDTLKRFDNEAKAAAKFKSRHVPQVYDNGVLEDGTPYLAMELLHGETLFTRVHRGGPVPLPEAVTILEQCCRALGRAHTLGIIHRDVKPENIFLAHSVDDDNYIVKILDFGIAKMTALDAGQQSTTRTGTLLGTPMYMSPEQARGLRTIDFRTDLYSLGLVSYMMFTGNVAFGGETLGELLLQICTQPLPSLIASARWLPPPMEQWFHKACAREPGDRFPTAQAFVESLRMAAGLSAPGDRSGPLPQMTPHGVAARPPGPMDLRPAPTTSDATVPNRPQPSPPAYRPPEYPSTTGAAVETFDGRVSGAAPGGRGRVVAAVVMGVIGLALGGVGVTVFVHKREVASATAPAVAAASAAPTASSPPVASVAASDTPSAASAVPATSDSSADMAVPPSKPPPGTTTWQPPSKGPAAAAPPAPRPQPPAKPNKPGTVDLGY
jgi:serine/threonine protein kinase